MTGRLLGGDFNFINNQYSNLGLGSLGCLNTNANGMYEAQLAMGIAGSIFSLVGQFVNSKSTESSGSNGTSVNAQLDKVNADIKELCTSIGKTDIQSVMNMPAEGEPEYQKAVDLADGKEKEAQGKVTTANEALVTAKNNVNTAKKTLSSLEAGNPKDQGAINQAKGALEEAIQAQKTAENNKTEAELLLKNAKKELETAKNAQKTHQKELKEAQKKLDILLNEKEKLQALVNSDKTALENAKLLDKADGEISDRSSVDDVNKKFDNNGQLSERANIRDFRSAFAQYRYTKEEKWAKNCIAIYEDLNKYNPKDLKSSDIQAYLYLKDQV